MNNNVIDKFRKCIFATKPISKKVLLTSVVMLLMFLGYLWNVSPIIRGNTVILKMYHCGLGNQLFQYSAAYAFAKKTNSNFYVLLPKSFAKHNNMNSKDRYFELYKFGIKKEQIIYNTTLNQISFKILVFFKKINAYAVNEKNFFNFDKEDHSHNLYYIKNTFQDIKYFKNIKNEVRELFNISNLKTSRTEKLLEQLQQKNSVCIHSRLGDWKTTFGELDNDYYYEALKLIKSKINNPKFYIFSDDIKESKQKFKDFQNFQYMDGQELLPIEDFFLLANCSHVINSISTFNWWSSFLNTNTDKIIIAPFDHNSNPEGWFGIEDFKINASDIKNYSKINANTFFSIE